MQSIEFAKGFLRKSEKMSLSEWKNKAESVTWFWYIIQVIFMPPKPAKTVCCQQATQSFAAAYILAVTIGIHQRWVSLLWDHIYYTLWPGM